ncbi:MAG: glycosyltransferase, partial [Chitinophagaceae bacterium]|nr:glycosyltransferase [Chitinophagaceae bacterium]
MLWYRWAWQATEPLLSTPLTPTTRISVVVAARNEALHIERCVASILAQDYPAHLVEIIVVDDCSTDSTLALLQAIPAANLHSIAMAPLLQA